MSFKAKPNASFLSFGEQLPLYIPNLFAHGIIYKSELVSTSGVEELVSIVLPITPINTDYFNSCIQSAR